MFQITHDGEFYVLKVTYSYLLIFCFTREWKVRTKEDLSKMKWIHDKIMGTFFTSDPDELIEIDTNFTVYECIKNNDIIEKLCTQLSIRNNKRYYYSNAY